MTCNNKFINKEVSIEYPLFQSENGRYFIGETPVLTTNSSHSMAALVNPLSSNVNIYLNAITVTNVTNTNISIDFYLKSSIPNTSITPLISCTNTSFSPIPSPYGQIQYSASISSPPNDGISIFNRIASPYSSEIVDGGQIILAPGTCILVYLGNLLPIPISGKSIIAFGWWEERISHRCSC